jgi:hypothetical protein
MLLAQMSDTAIVEIVFGVLTVVGAAGGSWGAVKWSMAALTTEVAGLKMRLDAVADGDTKPIGKIEVRLDGHDTTLVNHDRRLSALELHCATRSGLACLESDRREATK